MNVFVLVRKATPFERTKPDGSTVRESKTSTCQRLMCRTSDQSPMFFYYSRISRPQRLNAALPSGSSSMSCVVVASPRSEQSCAVVDANRQRREEDSEHRLLGASFPRTKPPPHELCVPLALIRTSACRRDGPLFGLGHRSNGSTKEIASGRKWADCCQTRSEETDAPERRYAIAFAQRPLRAGCSARVRNADAAKPLVQTTAMTCTT